MSMPMPIELVLAAHDFKIPCMMSIQWGCGETTAYIITFGHGDGTPHCDPNAVKLPLCTPHTNAARMACAGGPLMELLGAGPPPNCTCGQGVTIHRITDVYGAEVW